jgi:hypothetical protein
MSVLQAEGAERQRLLNEHQDILCSPVAAEYIADQITHLSGRVRQLEVGLSAIRDAHES